VYKSPTSLSRDSIDSVKSSLSLFFSTHLKLPTFLSKMFFSKSLAVLTTLAFGALSALAAPAPISPVENALAARCDCQSVPAIFADLTVDIQVNLNALSKFDVVFVEVAVALMAI
jgi:hypothetical protein